jgi:glycosyltransferase involved in cell wall biosynthesis
MNKISIVIITYNEERRIRQTIESAKWCDEIVVVDSGSIDKTLDICKEYSNCKIYSQVFLGYGLQKKIAIEKASNDWVLSIDADEVITDALRNELISIPSNPVIPVVGFYVPVTLVFMNKIFRFGCENKKLHLRFFNKREGNFDACNLHESVNINGHTLNLKNELLHYSYHDIHHYFQKFNEYTSKFADGALKKSKHVGRFVSVFRLILEFFRQYFIRRNFLNGYPGFVWSVFSSFYVFVKLTKLYEKKMKIKLC